METHGVSTKTSREERAYAAGTGVAQRSNQNKISCRRGVVWSDAVVVSTGPGEAGDAVRGEATAVDDTGVGGAENAVSRQVTFVDAEAVTKGHVNSGNSFHSPDFAFLIRQMRIVEAFMPRLEALETYFQHSVHTVLTLTM